MGGSVCDGSGRSRRPLDTAPQILRDAVKGRFPESELAFDEMRGPRDWGGLPGSPNGGRPGARSGSSGLARALSWHKGKAAGHIASRTAAQSEIGRTWVAEA